MLTSKHVRSKSGIYGLMTVIYKSTLIRERFTIKEVNTLQGGETGSIVASSNRITVALHDDPTRPSERYVVRAQNMHLCVRMAAAIVTTLKNNGPIMSRQKMFDWQECWDNILNPYDVRFNTERWVVVYHEGVSIFTEGDHHAFLDVIEKFDFEQDAAYDDAVPMAETAFKKAGKSVHIDHEATVAMVVNFERYDGRCAVIVRSAERTTTFSCLISGKEQERPINVARALRMTAAFLEGVQLAYVVGMGEEKIVQGDIPRFSREEKEVLEGKRRLGVLNSEISAFEQNYTAHYRPEKPSFSLILDEARLAAEMKFT